MTTTISHALQIKPSQAKSALVKAIKAKLVPILHGSPAIGKSSIVHDVAAQFNLKVIDLRLSQCEPQDMLGFPYIDKEKNKAGYTPMDTFPIEGDTIPTNSKTGKAYDGWLLFLDEITSATPPVQAAAYKLVLDRMVGQYHLHDRVVIVGAGNLEGDNAVVHQMSTALKSRLVHLQLRLDVKEWLNWAVDHGIDYKITSYIEFKPDDLYTFDPNTSDLTYAAPRTWEFTDRIYKVCGNDADDLDFFHLASGAITEGVTRNFQQFCSLFGKLPSIQEIVNNPLTTDVPEEPGVRYALSGSIGNHFDATNADKLLQYILRMPVEFQVITLRYVMKKNTTMRTNPVILQWATKHGALLF